MRKNLEVPKNKNGKVADGVHEIGQINVYSGQIAISDSCNSDNPDLTVDTNFGDGVFPVYEQWENNKRIGLFIPLSTDFHDFLAERVGE